jgi:hypothetical protein
LSHRSIQSLCAFLLRIVKAFPSYPFKMISIPHPAGPPSSYLSLQTAKIDNTIPYF